MKKLIVGLLAIGLFTGCSTKPPEKVDAVKQEEKQSVDQKEDKYIKTTIVAAEQIIEEAATLKNLLTEMNVDDTTWKNDVNYALMKIKSAANDYTGSEIVLSKEQLQKFENTSKYFDEGVSQLHAIADDGSKAVESYDKKILDGLNTRIDQASLLIVKATTELETERNKE